MTAYDEDKILAEAWNKMTPAQQARARKQIEACRKATAAAEAALREHTHLTKVEDREYRKLAKCYGVPAKVFVD